MIKRMTKCSYDDKNAGFHVMDSILVKGNSLSECILIGRKKSTFDVSQLSKSKKLGKERVRI